MAPSRGKTQSEPWALAHGPRRRLLSMARRLKPAALTEKSGQPRADPWVQRIYELSRLELTQVEREHLASPKGAGYGTRSKEASKGQFISAPFTRDQNEKGSHHGSQQRS